MHTRTWHFRLRDKNVIDCASYFGKRASEVAAALNCELVASKVVTIEELRGDVRNIWAPRCLKTTGRIFWNFEKTPIACAK